MKDWITIDELVVLHAAAIEAFGGTLGLRDAGLLESAARQPLATFGGSDLLPSLCDKAAALGFYLGVITLSSTVTSESPLAPSYSC